MDTLTTADLHAVELAPRRLMSVTIFQVENLTAAAWVNQGSGVGVATIGGGALVVSSNHLNVGNTFALDR